MFAKMAFQLQLFALPLVLFSIFPYKPLFNLLTESQNVIGMATLSSLGFLICLGNKTKFKSILTAITLVFNFLILFNILYLYPTLGIIALILFLFGTFHFLNRLNVKTELSSIIWTDLLISFLLFLIPVFIVPKNEIFSSLLFQYSMNLSSLTFLYLSTNYLVKPSKYLTAIFGLASLVPLSLMITNQILILDLTFIFFLVLSIILFGYVSFRPQSIKAIEKQYDSLFTKPELIVIGYFLSVAFIGAFFLQLGISQANQLTKHSFIDSFFTTISAVCVTGLAVFNTPVDFTFFGQGVILILIQLGGLGITTLSAWILLILSSGRLSYSHEETLYSMSGSAVKLDVGAFLKKIATYFFAVELMGAFFLFLGFFPYYDSWTMALWHAIFTSISAFCNAGFALQSDSLIPFNQSPFILFTVSFLIILGGFAPLMALELPKKLKNKKLNLQDKLALITTISLLILGFVFFLSAEWGHSLSNLNIIDKISNSWFQSVTTRTAGFNSVDLTETRSITLFVIMALMFIGGNPGSTAGGIKTITMAILTIAAFNSLKENYKAEVFGRWIPYKTIFRSILIFMLGVIIHFVAYFFMSVTQHNINPIDLLFEVFSALGTVGLSTGATVKLDEIGKIIIIFCMLIGRVGPLTFLLLLIKQNSKQRWTTPEEDVIVT